MVKKNSSSQIEKASFKSRFIKELEEIFAKAMESGKLNVALKAKELLWKIKEFFSSPNKKMNSASIKPIEEWSSDEIETFIENLEKLNKK